MKVCVREREKNAVDEVATAKGGESTGSCRERGEGVERETPSSAVQTSEAAARA